MAVRWQCPNGCPGVLGPQRPRKNNIVRYCLPCSAEAGVLVERSAPSVERKREARSEVTAERRKRKADRERERRYVHEGIDYEKLMRKYLRLPAFRVGGRPMGAPELVLVRHRYGPSSRLGSAWGSYQVRLNLGPRMPWQQVTHTLIHELVHIYGSRTGKFYGHDRGFRDKEDEAMMQAFPGIVFKSGGAIHVRGGSMSAAIARWAQERDLDEPRKGVRLR